MTTTKRASALLWTVQAVLAALFLYAGGFKLALPLAALAKLSPLPPPLPKFVGVCEVTGAIGLVLPGLLKIRTGLTPLAAAGLVVIMVGATVVTVATQGVAPAVLPFVVGILAATVAYGRWQRAPLIPLRREQQVRLRRLPGHRQAAHHAPVVRRHAASLGVQARLASRAVPHRSGLGVRRGGGRRVVPDERRREDVAGARRVARPRHRAQVAAGRRWHVPAHDPARSERSQAHVHRDLGRRRLPHR